jgi:D-glycero-beta-D-manno-heptose 1-phosphate adenylyltransferase
MRNPESKIIPLAELEALSERLRRSGQRIVTTNGCFDLLHWGHLAYLRDARSLGDCLICGLNSDASVKRLKGVERPLVAENYRALQLASLEAVDYVTIFGETTPEKFLANVKPSVHVKGGDYRPEDLPERKVVEASGGKVVCVSLIPGFSTTALIAKLKA